MSKRQAEVKAVPIGRDVAPLKGVQELKADQRRSGGIADSLREYAQGRATGTTSDRSRATEGKAGNGRFCGIRFAWATRTSKSISAAEHAERRLSASSRSRATSPRNPIGVPFQPNNSPRGPR